MNTSVLSQFVNPAIPDVVKFSSTRTQDSILTHRQTARVSPQSVGPFSSNGTKQIMFKLQGRNFFDLSALRLQFTLQAGAVDNFIQDGCPIIRSVQIYLNGSLVESMTSNFSLFQNALYYYSAHDSSFATQLSRSGFWNNKYCECPKPSDVFSYFPAVVGPPALNAGVYYTGGTASGATPAKSTGNDGFYTEAFEIPLSLLGLTRSKKLFPAMLLNQPLQIVIELASKSAAMVQITSNAANAVIDKPSAVGNVSDYQILPGTCALLYDTVDCSEEYLAEVFRVANEGSFSFVIDTFDVMTQTILGSMNNVVITNAKMKLKDLYTIFKSNSSPSTQLTDTYSNPLMRRFQLLCGSAAFPAQAVGGRTSGMDSDILLNQNEVYDQLLISLNELGNVLAQGIVPFKNKDNGTCTGATASQTVPAYKICNGNGLTTDTFCGRKFMMGINLEANLDSLLSGIDSKSAGGVLTLAMELETTPDLSMITLLHYDRQLVFSKGSMFIAE